MRVIVDGMSHRARRRQAKPPATVAELHRLDVLGTRAFRTPAFRVGHLLAFMQFLETDALEAR